jgi:hypothetical protein
MISTDALADAHYAAYDPQYADIEAEERASMNEAIDEFISTIDTAIFELNAIKDNFTTRRFNQTVEALEEIKTEVEAMKTDE